jgi:hypothetical protein
LIFLKQRKKKKKTTIKCKYKRSHTSIPKHTNTQTQTNNQTTKQTKDIQKMVFLNKECLDFLETQTNKHTNIQKLVFHVK